MASPQLRAEKLQQRVVEFFRLFNHRDVAALVKHHQLGPLDAVAKLLAAGQRDQLILPSPHHQRWYMNGGQLRIFKLGGSSKSGPGMLDRVSIVVAHAFGKGMLNSTVRNYFLVVENRLYQGAH